MTAARWHALHVYRYPDQDDFLVHCLAPVVADLRRSGDIDGYFFLRYWQGGHHLRVRLLAPANAEPVLTAVADRFRAYLAANPTGQSPDGFEQAQTTMAGLEGADAEELQPPDTIRRVEYHPELDKYGGAAGVAIAERYFERSSDVVLASLPALSRRPARLGAAFAMMVRALRAAGHDAAAQAGFFARYCLLWAPYVFEESLTAWPQLLAARRGPLAEHVRRTFAAGLPDDPFSVAVTAAMRAVADDADRILPRVVLAGADRPAEDRRHVLLVSHLHTHNNRLGLIPEQEALLGYLAHHVLSELAGPAPAADLLPAVRSVRERRLGSLLPAATS